MSNKPAKRMARDPAILIPEWPGGRMVVKNIPEFIRLELNILATFNSCHLFNLPLKRLQQIERAIQNQAISLLKR
ncbi:DUF6965 family protein [Taibaiella koreensis]|uniref:DUF6965 family protein n=1 Tax=Taibaiella koreensis TaxID=1268548 RepID=UPI0013C2EA15|nr:hypothetical protein [Taibaiella koreensis]